MSMVSSKTVGAYCVAFPLHGRRCRAWQMPLLRDGETSGVSIGTGPHFPRLVTSTFSARLRGWSGFIVPFSLLLSSPKIAYGLYVFFWTSNLPMLDKTSQMSSLLKIFGASAGRVNPGES